MYMYLYLVDGVGVGWGYVNCDCVYDFVMYVRIYFFKLIWSFFSNLNDKIIKLL